MIRQILRATYMGFGFFSLISATTPVTAWDAASLSIGEWEALWTKVLARHVDESGRIDFDALSGDHADLDRVIAFIAAVDPVSRPERFPDCHVELGRMDVRKVVKGVRSVVAMNTLVGHRSGLGTTGTKA